MICTFFGHRDTPDSVRPMLKYIIEKLISDGISLFYVGNEGNFDRIVLEELQIIQMRYPHIEYYVVLANLNHDLDPQITLYPDGMENALPRFAIDKRNRWMIKQADIVISYVVHYGSAKKYRDIAWKQGKIIIDLS